MSVNKSRATYETDCTFIFLQNKTFAQKKMQSLPDSLWMILLTIVAGTLS